MLYKPVVAEPNSARNAKLSNPSINCKTTYMLLAGTIAQSQFNNIRNPKLVVMYFTEHISSNRYNYLFSSVRLDFHTAESSNSKAKLTNQAINQICEFNMMFIHHIFCSDYYQTNYSIYISPSEPRKADYK